MKVNLIEQARKETDLKKSILKSAKDCAKHFDNKTNQDQKCNFSIYCSKKIKKILKLKAIPSIDEIDKIQNKLDLFDKIFYVNQEVGDHDQVSSEEVLSDDKCNEDQVSNCDEEEMSDDQNQSDENQVGKSVDKVQNTLHCEYQDQNSVEQAKNSEHQVQNGKDQVHCCVDQYQINVNEGQSKTEDQFTQSDNRNLDLLMAIPQLDGCDDFDLSEKGNMEKQIYGVNCEINEIIQLINFVRSFNFLWISTDSHWLCSLHQECFFCYMRSTCLRLRKEREKGPKMVQLNEFVNQLFQYESLLGWNWRESATDMAKFIENTIRLIHKRETISPYLFLTDDDCQLCKEDISDCILKVDIEQKGNEVQVLTINELIQHAITKRNQIRKCCHVSRKLDETCFIIQLPSPASINILEKEDFNGVSIIPITS